jgi:flagella basal body P-ring formation protein FlgA
VPEGIVLEGAPDVRIGVKSTTLSGEKLVEFGRKELESRSQVAGVTFSIEDPKAPSPVTIRGTDVTLRAEVSPRKPWGLVPVTVEAWSVGKRQARFIMSFRVRATGPVAQLARGVEPGAVITDDDLVEAERDLSTVPDDAIRSREAIVGLTVARAMQSGSYVRRGSVKQSALVKKGGQVTLVARVGTVEARANAQSRDDGASGDVVTVVNMASRRTIRARVVSQDEVEAVVP